MEHRKPHNKKVVCSLIIGVIAVAVCIAVAVVLFGGGESKSNLKDKTFVARSAEEAARNLAAIEDQLGYKNALSELTEKSTTTIDGDTYYRLQQNYQGIPVYGRTAVYVTDMNGKTLAITGNVIDVIEDFEQSPLLTALEAETSIKTYMADELGYVNTEHVSIERLNKNDLVIYNMGETGMVYLAYVLYVDFYEFIVDAHMGSVLCCSKLLYESDTTIGYAASDASRENGFGITLNDAGIYELTDATHRLSVYTLQNLNSEELLKSIDKGTYFDWKKVQLIESQDVIFGNSKEEVMLKAERGAQLLLNVIDVQDYFCQLGFLPAGKTLLFYNDGYKEGENARAGYGPLSFPQLGENGDSYGVLFMGSITGVNDVDVIAHEYTHRVSRQIIAWSGRNTQKDALNEALSDIFGVMIEARLKSKGLDWIIEGDNTSTYRNIADPRETGYRAVLTDENNSRSAEEYAYSTVISHAAYLMSEDGGGLLTIDELAKLWYRAMLMMPSDCDFAECRTLVELAGESMELSDKKIQCIRSAFDNVGIQDNTIVDYTIDENVELNVYGAGSKLHGNYTISITGKQLHIENLDKLDKDSLGIPLDIKYISTMLTVEYSNVIEIKEAQSVNLQLPLGVYTITLYDNTDNSKTYSFCVSVGGSGNKDKLDIYTDFTTDDIQQETAPNTGPTVPETGSAEQDETDTINALNALLVGIYYDPKRHNGDVEQWTDEAVFCALGRTLFWDGFSDSTYLTKAGITGRQDGDYIRYDLDKVHKLTRDMLGREFPDDFKIAEYVSSDYVSGNEMFVRWTVQGEANPLTVQDFTRDGNKVLAVGTATDNYGAFIGCFEAVFEINPSSIYGYTLRTLNCIDGKQTAGRLKASASSELKETGITHYAKRAIDGNKDTAWVEGAQGVGIDEWIKLETTDGSKMTVYAIELLLGYQKNSKLLQDNGWPNKVLIECESGYTQETEFFSCDIPGTIVLQQPQTTRWVKITILDAVSGAKYDDICISEIYLHGTDRSEDTTEHSTESSEGLSKTAKQLLKIVCYGKYTDSLGYCYELSYNDKNQLVGLAQGEASSETKSTPTFTYSPEGKLLWIITGEPTDSYAPGYNSGSGYEYNSSGQLIKEFGWEGGYAEKKYKYDSAGKCVGFVENGDFYTSTETYVYGADGVRLYSEVDTIYSYGSDEHYIVEYDYSYLPFVLEHHKNTGWKVLALPIGDNISVLNFLFMQEVKFYTDEEGYLEKAVTESETYYFYYSDTAVPGGSPAL